MKYQSQKVALYYFVGALVLFLSQVTFGALAGAVYVWPNLLAETLPFNIIRMIHTNSLIVWLLMGFMGAAYYLIPEESETEIYSPLIAKIQFWLFLFGGAAAIVGYIMGIHGGREFLEQPLWIKLAIVQTINKRCTTVSSAKQPQRGRGEIYLHDGRRCETKLTARRIGGSVEPRTGSQLRPTAAAAHPASVRARPVLVSSS